MLMKMVRALFAESRKARPDEARLRHWLQRIDTTVLGAYGLFAPAEQRLLSLFEGQPRPGLPLKSDPWVMLADSPISRHS